MDVFAWSYQDLKTYQPAEVQHYIPLKPEQKPFKQKLRRHNPTISGTIFAEIQKLLDAKIIYPIHHSEWLANIVPVRKKS
ncbi:hypothetical protein KI387_024223, partial [Taxus chinensis]